MYLVLDNKFTTTTTTIVTFWRPVWSEVLNHLLIFGNSFSDNHNTFLVFSYDRPLKERLKEIHPISRFQVLPGRSGGYYYGVPHQGALKFQEIGDTWRKNLWIGWKYGRLVLFSHQKCFLLPPGFPGIPKSFLGSPILNFVEDKIEYMLGNAVLTLRLVWWVRLPIQLFNDFVWAHSFFPFFLYPSDA